MIVFDLVLLVLNDAHESLLRGINAFIAANAVKVNN